MLLRRLSAFRCIVGTCAILSTVGVFEIASHAELAGLSLATMALGLPQAPRRPARVQPSLVSTQRERTSTVDKLEVEPEVRFEVGEITMPDSKSVLVVVKDTWARNVVYILRDTENKILGVSAVHYQPPQEPLMAKGTKQ